MLAAEAIYKKYKHSVLAGVSLNVSEGEIIGIAGENGSGKSTLLSILVTLTSPDSGKVTMNGNPLTQDILKSSIGYVPQENALFDHLTVQDNLRFWAAAYCKSWKEVIKQLNNLLFLEEADFLRKKVFQLSGGMKKRLSIALACLHNPHCLVMDEPSAALDIGFKHALYEILQEVKSQGGCVVFTSHQPDELLWCDRIYVLHNGVFAFEGKPQELGYDLSSALYSLYGREVAR